MIEVDEDDCQQLVNKVAGNISIGDHSNITHYSSNEKWDNQNMNVEAMTLVATEAIARWAFFFLLLLKVNSHSQDSFDFTGGKAMWMNQCLHGCWERYTLSIWWHDGNCWLGSNLGWSLLSWSKQTWWMEMHHKGE